MSSQALLNEKMKELNIDPKKIGSFGQGRHNELIYVDDKLKNLSKKDAAKLNENL